LSPVHEIRFKPQQSIFGNASGIFQTIEKYLMVNGIKRCRKKRLERCLSDIADWMTANMLKLNQEKTELIIFAPKHQVKHFSDFRLKFDGTVLSDVSCVKNLGMYFDKTISMEQQASAITRSCFQQIRNIGRIRSLISVDACRTLVSSLVISRLDYGNALLYGTNNKIISKLQRVQNTAARLITRKRKYDSITPKSNSKKVSFKFSFKNVQRSHIPQ
jgi:hypothetical protein